MAITVNIKPKNGLVLPKVGHVPHGEHEVDLTAADLKGAQGVSIVKGKPATK
jgi:hypothetical protein